MPATRTRFDELVDDDATVCRLDGRLKARILRWADDDRTATKPYAPAARRSH